MKREEARVHDSSSVSEEPIPSPPKPLWRGRLHQVALLVAIPAAVRLVVATPSGAVRVATTIYAFSLVGLLATSSAYHGLNWSPSALSRMQSLDHSMIFFLIAGTYTAFGILALRGLSRVLVVAGVWIGALAGIAIKLIKINRLDHIASVLYIVLGWTGILVLPQVMSELETLPVAFVVSGGLMYTVGAVVLLRRRPDPNPRVFGYHEVWHALVIAASTCHYVAITMLLPA